MALDNATLEAIRDEIGSHDDFAASSPYDPETQLGSLEEIYNAHSQGDGRDAYRAALVVWKRRLAAHLDRSFDVTTEGTLLSRRQKIAFMERRIKEIELLVGGTAIGVNMNVVSELATEPSLSGSAEFSG